MPGASDQPSFRHLHTLKIGGRTVTLTQDPDEKFVLLWNGMVASGALQEGMNSGFSASDKTVVIAGRMPEGATTVEVVALDGSRELAVVRAAAWIIEVSDNDRGIDAYPVLFRNADGQIIRRHVPQEWSRGKVDRDRVCPACLTADEWDLVTPEWEERGQSRSARWGSGYATSASSVKEPVEQPTKAFVCCVCGHAEPVGIFWHYPKADAP